MIKFFKPEDFEDFLDGSLKHRNAAGIANTKLEVECVRVYNKMGDDKGWVQAGGDIKTMGFTHQARLFDIREIEIECEHRPLFHAFPDESGDSFFVCSLCNKGLRPTGWELSE